MKDGIKEGWSLVRVSCDVSSICRQVRNEQVKETIKALSKGVRGKKVVTVEPLYGEPDYPTGEKVIVSNW